MGSVETQSFHAGSIYEPAGRTPYPRRSVMRPPLASGQSMADFGRVDIEWSQREAIESEVAAFKGGVALAVGSCHICSVAASAPTMAKISCLTTSNHDLRSKNAHGSFYVPVRKVANRLKTSTSATRWTMADIAGRLNLGKRHIDRHNNAYLLSF